MISAAIQTAIAAIIPNTYTAMGDEEIITPYCVHKESGEPQYLKAGIVGYEYQCEVAIIDDTPDAVELLVQSVKNAILALAGTTSSSTAISSVTWLADDPDFDPDARMYISLLKFLIHTTNR